MISAGALGRDSSALLRNLGWSCLIAGAFFLPFVSLVPGPAEAFPGIRIWDWQRIFQGGLIGSGLGLMLLNVATERFRFLVSTVVLWGWAAIAGLSAISALTAFYPKAALLDWAWMHALTLLALFSAWLFSQAKGRWENHWLAPAGIATLLYTFWFFVANSDYLFSYDFRAVATAFPGFSKSRYFSDFQSVLLFLCPLAVQRYLSGRRSQALGWLMVGLFYMLAFVAGSRSILAGQVIAHGLLFLVGGKAYLRQFRMYMLCWGAGVVLYWLIIVLYAPWSASFGDPGRGSRAPAGASVSMPAVAARYDSSGRGQLIEKSFRLMSSAPWLGIGGRHYGCYIKTDFHDPLNPDNGDAAHPHNGILQLAVEWGLPVALTVTTAVAWLLIQIGIRIGRDQTEDDRLTSALFGGLLALLVHAMVTGVLNAPVSQMLLVLFLGWSMSLVCTKQVRLRSRAHVLVFCAAVAGLGLGMGWLFMEEAWGVLLSANSNTASVSPTWYLAPRFWQQGWLLPLCGGI